MKNYGDRGGCYPSRPEAEADNSLRELNNSSYDTQPHSLIVKYSGNGAPVATERITADLKPFFGTKSTCSSHPTHPPPPPRGLPFDAQRSYKKKNRCDFHWIRRLSTSQLMSSLSGDFSVETTPFEG